MADSTVVDFKKTQDGRQAMTGSIGLPEFFMDESKWQLILLVYFGAMIFGLPIVVWRWCGLPYSVVIMM